MRQRPQLFEVLGLNQTQTEVVLAAARRLGIPPAAFIRRAALELVERVANIPVNNRVIERGDAWSVDRMKKRLAAEPKKPFLTVIDGGKS
jgi:hypothetical protein